MRQQGKDEEADYGLSSCPFLQLVFEATTPLTISPFYVAKVAVPRESPISSFIKAIGVLIILHGAFYLPTARNRHYEPAKGGSLAHANLVSYLIRNTLEHRLLNLSL